MDFPGFSSGKESPCQCRCLPGSGRSPGEGNGNPLQFFAWRIPWIEEPGRLQSMGSHMSDMTEQVSTAQQNK